MGNKDKLKKPLKIYEYHLLILAKEKNWKGIGTVNDPFVIPSSESFSEVDNLKIIKSKLYVKFESYKFKSMALEKSNNIMFHNCQFDNLTLSNSAESVSKYLY
ncbi:hypothetical protein LCGC14_2525680 [marine sediment metagenome]|uniref:Uncharacterized protein n=1 Tax=marine sediment metagenome TaxID=412755 RepID=A0A0F9DNC5_9ZZZZ